MPAAIPLGRLPAAVRGEPRLERETMLLPHLAAERVCAEAAEWTGSKVPWRFAPWLARRVRQLYATNRGFNRRLRSESGREWLATFLRHWLTARLRREHPRLAHSLPVEFAVGVEVTFPGQPR